jgi:hypothetical protein
MVSGGEGDGLSVGAGEGWFGPRGYRLEGTGDDGMEGIRRPIVGRLRLAGC